MICMSDTQEMSLDELGDDLDKKYKLLAELDKLARVAKKNVISCENSIKDDLQRIIDKTEGVVTLNEFTKQAHREASDLAMGRRP